MLDSHIICQIPMKLRQSGSDPMESAQQTPRRSRSWEEGDLPNIDGVVIVAQTGTYCRDPGIVVPENKHCSPSSFSHG